MSGLEALVAIGLADNIAQFTQFAHQLLSRARRLYKSTTGVTAENEELQLITQNLRKLAETEDLRILADNTQQYERLLHVKIYCELYGGDVRTNIHRS
jgi:hypothetical protein